MDENIKICSEGSVITDPPPDKISGLIPAFLTQQPNPLSL